MSERSNREVQTSREEMIRFAELERQQYRDVAEGPVWLELITMPTSIFRGLLLLFKTSVIITLVIVLLFFGLQVFWFAAAMRH